MLTRTDGEAQVPERKRKNRVRRSSMDGDREERTREIEASRLGAGGKARSDSAAGETEKMSQDKL